MKIQSMQALREEMTAVAKGERCAPADAGEPSANPANAERTTMSDVDKDIPEPYRSRHKDSSHHRNEVLTSKEVGCFYCLEIYHPYEIREWIDNSQTAICPKCGIDSVLPNMKFPGAKKFLANMKRYWFAVAPLSEEEKKQIGA